MSVLKIDELMFCEAIVADSVSGGFFKRFQFDSDFGASQTVADISLAAEGKLSFDPFAISIPNAPVEHPAFGDSSSNVTAYSFKRVVQHGPGSVTIQS